MDQNEKLRLLKSLRLLDKIPESQLVTLGDFLKPHLLQEGTVIFEEGSKGNSLYFVSSGQIRISKKVSEGVTKDLAILSSGDCFGEMALIEEVSRSATAAAAGSAVVFELGRDELNRWLKSHPDLAMGFFAELVQVQSRRLRRTSNELTLLLDLSNLFMDQTLTSKQLVLKLLEHLLTHLEGHWSAAAYLHNAFNEEMELAASIGGKFDKAAAPPVPKPAEAKNVWSDKYTYQLFLPEQKRPLGVLLFYCAAGLSIEERNEVGRTLSMVGRLATTALDNINFRTDEALRARLKSTQAYGTRL